MNRDTRLVALALLLWGLGEGLFLYIQPLQMEELGAVPVLIGAILSGAGAVRALAFLPSGALADRLPRKPFILGAWVLGPLAAIVMGLASSWQGLVPGILLYAASAYCIPAINAYLARAVEGRRVERTFATVYAVHTVGGVVSPAIGGWLAKAAGMPVVYFLAAGLFALSAVAILSLSPQPVPPVRPRRARRRALLSARFVSFGALILVVFGAMYVGFPLAQNFLAEVRGWDLPRIGLLGSVQAAGMTLFGLVLGRIGDGRRAWGLAVGQVLVWASMALLLATGAFPLVGVAYLMRGAYQGCRSQAQARASRLGPDGERGVVLGATEALIAAAQIAAPYLAGWLYTNNPALPLWASLFAVPVALVLSVVALPRL